ncbi:techylectin-5B-like [Drosophila serrata]|uniref:techylectin-5B-like n=1 Tax=Drosophila serrata TaxID=7274 RepID=UPI000A1D1A13|nr:techylectin-5B-like [Drosophila serrata]
MQFSTKDHDNDMAIDSNCAEGFSGAWWYHYCFNSNLAGLYDEYRLGYFRWNTPNFNKALKTAIMMIRPKASTL